LNPSYNKYTPAASIGWGVFVSTTWGSKQENVFVEMAIF